MSNDTLAAIKAQYAKHGAITSDNIETLINLLEQANERIAELEKPQGYYGAVRPDVYRTVVRERDRLREGLRKIRDMDYRGNRHSSADIAARLLGESA